MGSTEPMPVQPPHACDRLVRRLPAAWPVGLRGVGYAVLVIAALAWATLRLWQDPELLRWMVGLHPRFPHQAAAASIALVWSIAMTHALRATMPPGDVRGSGVSAPSAGWGATAVGLGAGVVESVALGAAVIALYHATVAHVRWLAAPSAQWGMLAAAAAIHGAAARILGVPWRRAVLGAWRIACTTTVASIAGAIFAAAAARLAFDVAWVALSRWMPCPRGERRRVVDIAVLAGLVGMLAYPLWCDDAPDGDWWSTFHQ